MSFLAPECQRREICFATDLSVFSEQFALVGTVASAETRVNFGSGLWPTKLRLTVTKKKHCRKIEFFLPYSIAYFSPKKKYPRAFDFTLTQKGSFKRGTSSHATIVWRGKEDLPAKLAVEQQDTWNMKSRTKQGPGEPSYFSSFFSYCFNEVWISSQPGR